MINSLRKDTFLKNYAIYFTGSMVVAFLNYVFHPILGRILSPVEFGDLQAFLSLIAQAAIIFGAFSVVVVNITANTENKSERNAIIFELQKIALWIVIGLFIVLIVSLSKFQSFFNFSSIYPLIGLALTLPISALSVFRNAYLQGSGNFTKLSLSGIISALGRLVFSVTLITLGFGIGGATLGIIIANILVLIYLFLQTRGSLKLETKVDIHTLEKGSVKKELIYGLLVFFATGLVTVFYTIDVLIVKRYFSLEEAGLYSGVSAIAKIIFFAIGPSAAVLLSSIKLKNTFSENSAFLKKSLAVAFIIGGAGLFTFYTFSGIIVSLMIGGRYAVFAHFLPDIGLVMLLTAIMNVLVFYFLALRRFFLIPISILSGLFVIGMIFFKHTSIGQILSILSITLIIINCLLLLTYAKDYFNHSTRS